MNQFTRFLINGGATVGLYVGGVWFGTEIAGLPARPVNWVFYALATLVSFVFAYRWVFSSDTGQGQALFRYILLALFGAGLNSLWMEGGLRFTPLLPWMIAAAYFLIWPFISYSVQRHYIFK